MYLYMYFIHSSMNYCWPSGNFWKVTKYPYKNNILKWAILVCGNVLKIFYKYIYIFNEYINTQWFYRNVFPQLNVRNRFVEKVSMAKFSVQASLRVLRVAVLSVSCKDVCKLKIWVFERY